MHTLYTQALIGIKAKRKALYKALPCWPITVLIKNGVGCTCVLHKPTEDEYAKLLFEQSILAALLIDPEISIAVQFHDASVPDYLLTSMQEHLTDMQVQYRMCMRAHPLITVGVPSGVAEAFATHIENERENVISFFNEIGDPVTMHT